MSLHTSQSAGTVHANPRLAYEDRFADTLFAIRSRMAEFLQSEGVTIFGGATIEGPELLWQAMRYAALDAGKLIRPVMTVETCLACGGMLESALPTACAIELVHTQSLIHDDLPCMDNDDLRRGKPTLHKAFNEHTAVLTGDALLAYAFGIVSRHTPLENGVTAEKLLGVVSDFSDVSSVKGLVNGQYVDIYTENKPFDAATLEYIHTYKTGALFSFSTRAGAILSGANEEVVETMTRFGQKLGLAFQIVDDVLDIQSTTETLGKTVGKDEQQKKATYPALYGIDPSKAKANGLVSEAIAMAKSCLGEQAEPLVTLAMFINERIA